MALIDDWRSAHRLWSVRVHAAGIAVMGGLGVVSTEFPSVWASIPDDLRGKVPAWVGMTFLALGLALRLTKQSKPDG